MAPACRASSPNGTPSSPAAAAAAFPTVSGTFDENDLLAVSIGGNDARFYQQTGGTWPAPRRQRRVGAFATAGLNALVAAGAQNISFLAGDTSLLPEVAPTRPPRAIRSAFSTTFNDAIKTTLAGYAADGVMVHYLDLAVGSTDRGQSDRLWADQRLPARRCPNSCTSPIPADISSTMTNST